MSINGHIPLQKVFNSVRHNQNNDKDVHSLQNGHQEENSKQTGQSDQNNDELLKSMKKEMDELKSYLKGITSKNLDRMIMRADSPFTSDVLECLLPPKCRHLQLETYDGLKDPLDQIESFKMLLNLQQTLDELMCRSFPTMLRGAARVQLSKLASLPIANFEQLSDSFVRHFIGSQRYKKPTTHLLMVMQDGETLRTYVRQFNQAILEVDETDDQV